MNSLSTPAPFPTTTTYSSNSRRFSKTLHTARRWNLPTRLLTNVILQTSSSQRFLVRASVDSSQGKGSSTNDIIMVDPVEAKRLAEKQMQEIRAKEKFKRRRQAEAINGALAMIGLTAALVIEGQTGKGIFGQLAGYWDAVTSFLM